MKKFIEPALIMVDELRMEPVYAASGYTPDEPDGPENGPGGDWEITTDWTHHNTGHLSGLAIKAKYKGTTQGDVLTATFICHGFKLSRILSSSGFPVSNVSETGFTVTRYNHFNPGESVVFNLEITCKNSAYNKDNPNGEGAVADTCNPSTEAGVWVECISYTSA